MRAGRVILAVMVRGISLEQKRLIDNAVCALNDKLAYGNIRKPARAGSYTERDIIA